MQKRGVWILDFGLEGGRPLDIQYREILSSVPYPRQRPDIIETMHSYTLPM